MILRLVKYNEGPPDGFRFKDPIDGHWTRTVTWQDLLKEAKNHRRVNNLPIPANFDTVIEQQLCELLPPECSRSDEPKRPNYAHRVTYTEALEGVSAWARLAVSKERFIPQAEADERAKTCFHCHFNQPIQTGCLICLETFRDLAGKMTGNKSTPYDLKLHVCSLCNCPLKAKVWFPLSIVHSALSPGINESLPPWCWAKH
jgi:hypothetical protein